MERAGSEGWVTFSALTLGVAGVIHALVGVFAMYGLGPFTADNVPVSIYGWGVTMLFFGGASIVAGFLTNRRSNLGRVGGIILASLSLVMWAVWLGNNPVAATVAPLLDVLILYGLSTTKAHFS